MVKTKNAALNFIIAGDPSGAQKAMRVVGVEADGLGGRLRQLGGWLSAAAVVRWGQQTIATYRRVGGEQLKLMRLTGTTEEQASGLWVAAQQSGLGVDKLSAAIGILSSKIKTGATKELGLDLQDANGKALPLDQSLRKIADRVAGMDDGAEKNALVRSLFGRGGAELLPLLNKGGAAIDEMIDKADQLGLTLNSDDIKQATRNQRDFQLATTAAGYVIGKELLPVATVFTSWASRELPKVVGFASGIAGAFGALPGPIRAIVGGLVALAPAVKVLGMVAVPFKLISSAVTTGRAALDMFRLGLMGVTQAGAGAANSAGAVVAALGPAGVAGAVAGVGLITFALVKMSDQAAKNRQDVKDLRSDLEAGLSPLESMNDRLARTWADMDGGFSELEGSASSMKSTLEDLGVSTPDLAAALVGSDSDWAKLETRLGKMMGLTDETVKLIRDSPNDFVATTDTEEQYLALIRNLDAMRSKGQESVDQWNTYQDALGETGDAADDAAAAIGGVSGSLGRQSTALSRATSAVDTYMDRMNKVHDAESGVVSAHRASADAQADLAEAVRAARGDSEEYRSAREAIADAEGQVADAQDQVVEAQRDVLDAQEDLNDARAEARDRLLEMSQAARDAALSEQDAALKVKEAREELRRVLADPGSTATEKERARLDVKQAEEDARQAAEDNRSAQQKNQDAQAAGVEGDERVVEARKRVAEANRKVTDAENDVAEARRGVGEAEKAAAQVISDARDKVAEAQQRAEDARVAELEAWKELAIAQNGSVDGLALYREQLRKLAEDLDPSSPLAQRIATMIADIDEALRLGRLATGNPTPPTRDPDARAPRGGANARGPADPGVGGSSIVVEQNVTVNGTPRDQLRGMRTVATDMAGSIARATR